MDLTTQAVLVVAALVAAAVLALALALLLRLVRTRRDLRRAGLPTGPRWVFWGAVLYLLLPVDVLPDPVYLDDIGVLLLALRSMRAALPAGAADGSVAAADAVRVRRRGRHHEPAAAPGRPGPASPPKM